jgi:hypothetical protein
MCDNSNDYPVTTFLNSIDFYLFSFIVLIMPIFVKRKIASKTCALEFGWKLFAVFYCGFYFILSSTSLLHTVLSMGMKMNGHNSHFLSCPFPNTTNLYDVSSSSPIGPRAWSLSVLMPISAPMPNS